MKSYEWSQTIICDQSIALPSAGSTNNLYYNITLCYNRIERPSSPAYELCEKPKQWHQKSCLNFEDKESKTEKKQGKQSEGKTKFDIPVSQPGLNVFFCFRGKIGNKAGTNIRLLPKTFVVVKSCKTSGWIRGTLREAGIVSARYSLVKAATTEQPLHTEERANTSE